ncbi:MAG: DNA topoisomerase (ATP-hydrolyzing) subunit A [Oscillospiraceae bacterium]|nr:DNA topoisomerase (ATP-hydrolyzing) subunit A [Oscillospiraceae bacterium]
MAKKTDRKSAGSAPAQGAVPPGIEGLSPVVRAVPITGVLRDNYMPYAMSVIVSRAIPEIDGFKPSHRKLLYTMYRMGLLTGGRTKSANVVGQTMRLNPHGESAIYETMVRLARGYEALLHPLVDSKGNFGKVYSRDMAYAASRYTEVKLDPICAELFSEIDRDAVDFTDNYDNTVKEPVLLPSTFPNILVSANQGIAVGMASQFCGFNLREVCLTAAAFLKNPKHDILETMPAPDFPTGGELIYDINAMREIYRTGRGGFRVRAKWRRRENVIEITEIPYSTTVEAIIDKCAELMKAGKLKDISDIRDETDLGGLRIAIDLKRGADADTLMARLFKMTPLQDVFSVNLNLLIAGTPFTLGVDRILEEWCAWRAGCVKRRLHFEAGRLRSKLHLLHGLERILLDIDRAIKIIRETVSEDEVIPNLMIGFGIDERQAEYVAEIKLRNINRAYLLKRTQETRELEERLADTEAAMNDPKRIRDSIIKDLKRVAGTYGAARKTTIVSGSEIEEYKESVEDYPVHVFVTEGGYIKKITPASLRLSSEQKLKENDRIISAHEAQNKDEILFFTDRQQVYKARLHDFEDAKASALGEYVAGKLGFEDGETLIYTCLPRDYSGCLLFAFQNGKVARVELGAYDTKSNRRKLTGAYSDRSPLASVYHLIGERELLMHTTEPRAVVFHSAQLAPKSTRGTHGVGVITPKGRHTAAGLCGPESKGIASPERFRVRSLPSVGLPLRAQDIGNVQLSIDS